MIKIISFIALGIAGFAFGIPKTLFPDSFLKRKILSPSIILLFFSGLILGIIDSCASQHELQEERARNKAMAKNISEFDSILYSIDEKLTGTNQNPTDTDTEPKSPAEQENTTNFSNTIEMKSRSSITLIRGDVIQLTKIPELSKYRKELNYYLCFKNKVNIWPMINLYGSSEMRSLSIPDNFLQGNLCIIKVDKDDLKEEFDWFIYNNLKNKSKLKTPDNLNIVHSISINIKP